MTGEAPAPNQNSRGGAWLVVVPVGLAVAVHASILGHFFFFDDFKNLYELRTSEPLDFVIRPHAEHLSIVRNLVMYLTYAVAGLDARPYFVSVLVVHALNVALLFGVVRRFSGRTGPAVLAAGLWGAAPVQQGTLGWYAVFGHAHALLFLLLVLWDLAGHQRDGRNPSVSRLVGWSALLAIGSTTFAVGIAMALVAGPAIYLLLYEDPRRGRILLVLGSSAIAVVALHLGLQLVYGGGDTAAGMMPMLSHPEAGWRALTLGLQLVVFGSASLLTGPLMWTGQGLERDPLYFSSPQGLWIFASLLAVTLAGMAVVVAAKWGRPLRQRLSALLLLLIASYGLIAIGRWWLTVTAGMHNIGVETRYHYLPTAVMAIALGLVLAALPLRRPSFQRAAAALGALWLVAVAGVGWATLRSDGRRQMSQRSQAEYERRVATIARVASETPEGKHTRLLNLPLHGLVVLDFGAAFPDWAALHIIAFPEGGIEDQRVRYVEFRSEVREQLREEGPPRASALLVEPRPGEKPPVRRPYVKKVQPE